MGDLFCTLCCLSFDLKSDYDNHIDLIHSDQKFFQDCKKSLDHFGVKPNGQALVRLGYSVHKDCGSGVVAGHAISLVSTCHFDNKPGNGIPYMNEHCAQGSKSSVETGKNYDSNISQESFMEMFEVEREDGKDLKMQGKKTRKGSFSCDVCKKTYTRKHDMLKHKRAHAQDDVSISHHTNDSFCEAVVDKQSLYPFPCPVCSRKYTRKHDMTRHMKQHSTDLPANGQVKDNELLKAKVVVNGKTMYRCSECNEHVSTRYGFVRHLRIHSGEKPFSCHICGKQFRISLTLYRHIREVHERIKNYPCDLCGRSFANSHSRNDHRRIHTNERPCVCHVCGKAFKTKASLYVHSKFHSNVFSHHCPHCSKGFHMKQNLNEHVLLHTGEKPHVCHICRKGFRTSHQLKNHILIHTNKQSYHCSVCGKRFAQERYLKNHARCYRGHTIN